MSNMSAKESETKSVEKTTSPTTPDDHASKSKSDAEPQDISIPIRVDRYKRIYHNIEQSPYMLPADIDEGNRLNMQHHMVYAALNSNYLVKSLKPQLEKGIKVLDVGTGTGYWAVEMSNEFPNSEFHGTDIALGEWTKAAEKDGKVKFAFGNVMEKLPYEDNTFDYVHQRFLCLGIPLASWPSVVQELKRVTKPGGWIELVEGDITIREGGPKITALNKAGYAVVKHSGIDLSFARNLDKLLTDGKLEAVQSDYSSLPMGWGGVIGDLSLKDWYTGSLNSKSFIAPLMNISVEEYEKLLNEAQQEVQTTAYWNVYWGIGQKKDE